MKRTVLLLMAFLLVLVLMACGGNVGDEEPEATAPAATDVPTDVPPSPAATATPEEYPAAPDAATATPLPDDYPAPSPQVPATAYPAPDGEGQSGAVGGQAWVLRPLGQQCEPESEYAYASLKDAVAALEDEGVTVLASETVNLMVCQACSCPTSEHFRVQVAPEDLGTAESLGWTPE